MNSHNDTYYYWLIFSDDHFLVQQHKDGSFSIPCSQESPIRLPEGRTLHEMDTLDSLPCRTFYITEKTECKGYEWIGLRASYDYICHNHYAQAGTAFQLLHWDIHSRYCSVCGAQMQQEETRMKRCPQCKSEVYPRISPAIIVRIQKEDSILLVHARNFRGNFHGLVAGFLEIGESLEECVHREVMEETGLSIRNLHYFGSQPWPYPSGIMIGFTAEYESGDIKLQDEELSSGSFFTKDNLPEIPRKLSLARKLIDDWLNS